MLAYVITYANSLLCMSSAFFEEKLSILCLFLIVSAYVLLWL